MLFNDTIFYNLQYGNFDAPPEKVYEAAKLADIHNTVLTLPKQYNTQVGERGDILSGIFNTKDYFIYQTLSEFTI